MKFERSELGALFSKLRTAVPEVRAVGTCLLYTSDAADD